MNRESKQAFKNQDIKLMISYTFVEQHDQRHIFWREQSFLWLPASLVHSVEQKIIHQKRFGEATD